MNYLNFDKYGVGYIYLSVARLFKASPTRDLQFLGGIKLSN